MTDIAKILSEIFSRHNGFVFEFIGDAFCVAFDTIEDAINSAIESQKELANTVWDDAEIKVRIGVHFGQAQKVGEKFTVT